MSGEQQQQSAQPADPTGIPAPEGSVLAGVVEPIADGKTTSTLAPAETADVFTKADAFYKDAVAFVGGLKEDLRERVQELAVKAGARWRDLVKHVKEDAAGVEAAIKSAPAKIEAWAQEAAQGLQDDAATAAEMDVLSAEVIAFEKKNNIAFVSRAVDHSAPASQAYVYSATENVPDGRTPATWTGKGASFEEAFANLETAVEAWEAQFKK